MKTTKQKQNIKNVTRWRIRAKQKLVDICGGECVLCGYDKCIRALEFHHLDKKQKEFGISQLGHTLSFSRAVEEIQKCIMVCANCHREIHDGLVNTSEIKPTFNEDIASVYLNEINLNRTKRRKQDTCRCGALKYADQHFCSKKCAGLNRKPTKIKITDDQLVRLYEKCKNYEKVGRQFGVTGAAIKRRLRKMKF